MSGGSNVSNYVPYLPTTRKFPETDPNLEKELVKMYNDVSSAVNFREIAIYDLTQVITGQQWFNTTPLTGNTQYKRQTFRQVYQVGTINAGVTSTIAHGVSNATLFTLIHGAVVTNAPDFRNIPYASATAVNQQIEIKADSTNITIINGSAAPNITSGIVVLEWLAQ